MLNPRRRQSPSLILTFPVLETGSSKFKAKWALPEKHEETAQTGHSTTLNEVYMGTGWVQIRTPGARIPNSN